MSPVPGTVPVPCRAVPCRAVPCHVPAQLLLVNCPTTSGMHWLRAQAGWQAGRQQADYGAEWSNRERGRRQQQMIRPGAGAVCSKRRRRRRRRLRRRLRQQQKSKLRVSLSKASTTRPTVGEKPRRHIDMERLPPDWRRQWRLLCSHCELDSQGRGPRGEAQERRVRRSHTMMTPTHICDVSTSTKHDERRHEALLAAPT